MIAPPERVNVERLGERIVLVRLGSPRYIAEVNPYQADAFGVALGLADAATCHEAFRDAIELAARAIGRALSNPDAGTAERLRRTHADLCSVLRYARPR